MANDVVRMEHHKKEAIEKEDFTTAKRLKIQMEQVQMTLASIDPNNPFAPIP